MIRFYSIPSTVVWRYTGYTSYVSVCPWTRIFDVLTWTRGSCSKFSMGKEDEAVQEMWSQMRETGRYAIISKRFDLFERKRISRVYRVCSRSKYPATRMANQLLEQALDRNVIFSDLSCAIRCTLVHSPITQ